MRVGLYIDVSNLYYSVLTETGQKVDYKKFLKYVEDFGEVTVKKAFVSLAEGFDNRGFIVVLESLKFEVTTKPVKVYPTNSGVKKKCDLDVEIVMELIRDMDKFDRVIIGCADGDLLPVYKYLEEHGKQVIILANKISSELRSRYEYFNIPPSLLLPESETKKRRLKR